MTDNSIGSILKISGKLKDELKDYQVILGFHGFGSIGYLVACHMIETMEMESFSFYGDSSWYYKNNLESTLTAYKLSSSKTILITTRVPIFVTAFGKPFWDKLVDDIFSWNSKRYIIIGGLKEDRRIVGSTDWAAFVPNDTWTEIYDHQRTFADKLSMIGPLSSLLTLGTALQKPVLGLLAYCNLEEDPDAALFTLSQLEGITDISIPNKENLARFNYDFLAAGLRDNLEAANSNNQEDFDNDSFDINDLL